MTVAIVLMLLGLTLILGGVIMYFVWNIKAVSDELSGKTSRKRVERLKRVNSGDPSELSTTSIDLYHDIQGEINNIDREEGSGQLRTAEVVSGWRERSKPVAPARHAEPVEVAPEPVVAVAKPVQRTEGVSPFGASTRFNLTQKLTSLSKD